MIDKSLFSRLRTVFSTGTVVRNIGGTSLKVMDADRIAAYGDLQTNSLVDRFTRLHKGGMNMQYNPTMNYQTLRLQLYNDYEAMDTDPILSSVLDIISEEATLKGEIGEILRIKSNNENIQKILYNLFYDILNIEFNLPMWIRSMCKFGDFYLHLDIAEKYGVYNVKPLSVYDIYREEGQDPNRPNYVKFVWNPVAVAGGTQGSKDSRSFENYEIAHFRLLSDSNFLPYGRSYFEPARKIYKQYSLVLDAAILHRIMRSPEKRIFYMNIGNIPPNEINAYMQNVINTMKKTPYIDQQTGDYNLKFNMQNMLEDFYIPVRPGDNTTRIETAKGLEYTGMDDVTFMRDLMLTAVKVPKAFLNYSDELNGKCIHPDTKIPLLTGEVKTIKEIADAFESSQDPNIWVYSYDKESDSIIPGRVVLAKKTRLNASLVKVTLDNGEYLITTPDHGFVLKGGERIDAEKLKTGDSLQAVYIEDRKVRNQQNEYQHVYQPNSNKWETTHKMVDNWLNGAIENNGYDENGKFIRDNMTVVHHKDFNRFNNHPDNLKRCSYREHSKIHTDNAEKGIWTESAKLKAKITKNTKEYKEKASLIGKEVMRKRCEKNPYSKYMVRDAWMSKTFEERSELVKSHVTENTRNKLREIGKATYAIYGENLMKTYVEKFNGVREDLRGSNNVRWVERVSIDSIISFIENYKGNMEDINRPKKLAKAMGYSLHVFEDSIIDSGWDIAEFFNEHIGFIKGRNVYVRKEYLIEILAGCSDIKNFKNKYNVGRSAIKTFKNILNDDIENYLNKTYNHKVVSVEYLDYTSDTYNMEVYDKNKNHNFLTSAGVIIKNSTISSLDLRFSKTIEKIQKVVVSELYKIALVHLYVQGYEDADLVNFELSLNNPSIIYEQEKIALLKEKVALAGDIIDKKLFSTDWIADKIFDMSEDQLNNERDLIVYDMERTFRYNQIENEGNDPAISGQSYGTPHDLASVYKANASGKEDMKVPDGYDENKNPVGRPQEKASIYKTDNSAFGRDPLGSTEMKGEPKNKRKDKIKPMALESQSNKIVKDLNHLKRNSRKILTEGIIEMPKLLDEKNIIEDTES